MPPVGRGFKQTDAPIPPRSTAKGNVLNASNKKDANAADPQPNGSQPAAVKKGNGATTNTFMQAKAVQYSVGGLALPPVAANSINNVTTHQAQQVMSVPPRDIVDEEEDIDSLFFPKSEQQKEAERIAGEKRYHAEWLAKQKAEKAEKRARALHAKQEADRKKADPYYGLPDHDDEVVEEAQEHPSIVTAVSATLSKAQVADNDETAFNATANAAVIETEQTGTTAKDQTEAEDVEEEVDTDEVNRENAELFAELFGEDHDVLSAPTSEKGQADNTADDQIAADEVAENAGTEDLPGENVDLLAELFGEDSFVSEQSHESTEQASPAATTSSVTSLETAAIADEKDATHPTIADYTATGIAHGGKSKKRSRDDSAGEDNASEQEQPEKKRKKVDSPTPPATEQSAATHTNATTNVVAIENVQAGNAKKRSSDDSANDEDDVQRDQPEKKRRKVDSHASPATEKKETTDAVAATNIAATENAQAADTANGQSKEVDSTISASKNHLLQEIDETELEDALNAAFDDVEATENALVARTKKDRQSGGTNLVDMVKNAVGLPSRLTRTDCVGREAADHVMEVLEGFSSTKMLLFGQTDGRYDFVLCLNGGECCDDGECIHEMCNTEPEEGIVFQKLDFDGMKKFFTTIALPWQKAKYLGYRHKKEKQYDMVISIPAYGPMDEKDVLTVPSKWEVVPGTFRKLHRTVDPAAYDNAKPAAKASRYKQKRGEDDDSEDGDEDDEAEHSEDDDNGSDEEEVLEQDMPTAKPVLKSKKRTRDDDDDEDDYDDGRKIQYAMMAISSKQQIDDAAETLIDGIARGDIKPMNKKVKRMTKNEETTYAADLKFKMTDLEAAHTDDPRFDPNRTYEIYKKGAKNTIADKAKKTLANGPAAKRGKKAASDDSDGPSDEEMRAAHATGAVVKFTIPQLKAWLRGKNLMLTGNKQVLVDRVVGHLNANVVTNIVTNAIDSSVIDPRLL